MTYGYRLNVYKTDRRSKTGEKLIKSQDYPNFSGHAMMDEIFSLKQRMYRPADGYRLDFEPMTTTVKSLMNGQMVEIDYRDLNTANDPSTERYWSM